MQQDIFDIVNNPEAGIEALMQGETMRWHPELTAWFVSDYEVGKSILTDERFSADIIPYLSATTFPSSRRADIAPILDLLSHWIVFQDPPCQQALKSCLAPFFSPKSLARMAPLIRQAVRQRLLEADDTFDWIETIAAPMPAYVMSVLLGFPASDAEQLLAWNQPLALFLESVIRTPDITKHALSAFEAQRRYLSEVLPPKPEHDLLGIANKIYQALTAVASGSSHDATSVWKLWSMLIGTGTETSRHLLGNVMYKQLMNQQSSIHPSASTQALIQETLISHPPVISIVRKAKEACVVAGHHIEQGQYIRIFTVGVASVHHEGGYPNHLVFGAGGHFCLGYALAMMTAQEVLNAANELFPEIQLVPNAPMTWQGGTTLRGLTSLKVKKS